MSKFNQYKRNTVADIQGFKGNKKIVCLTAYTAPMAEMLDKHCDLLLVGDTVGMVLHGMPDTVGVTLDMMIMHGQAVMRGVKKSLVVVDLPFASYEESKEVAYQSASRIMKEVGCDAVKVEAFPGIADTIKFLVDRGIPVVGHVGLRPQAINVSGGFKVQGRDEMSKEKILNDVRDAQEAGVFSIVLEGVPEHLAIEVSQFVSIPTIGIGASKDCDGQILVTDDMLGIFDWVPKFVRKYANLSKSVDDAVSRYKEDVEQGRFPNSKETYRFE
ncbi:3-methyl-2-oxobutanoate hydroxymethyltransferase [Microbulbifer sp. 2205BS26-8]|uniref:3-methyl-2-oxobutanoate hydroxymethyltransferase n=1 Tax=Microbulbifer sp. 2205BS26-8 TaxID=3064386 RepID=UPI00273F9053|nr:3-methyl-2-oxobutanoate hydroxymethyltransferase [Microbulbifer sp. 2205BS26-8]MDP5209447.1 3-methyl-2-oxobutanoate hydroxymethyltransferase [Microbulbifer sp. 2205BS26-8]